MARRRIKLTAYSSAQLLSINARRYGAEKGRETTRFRFTRQMLRGISGWKRLSELFLSEVSDEMYGLGWTVSELSDTEFAAIQTSKISVWPKIGNRRVMDLLKGDDPEDRICDVYDDLFPDPEEPNDSDD